MQTLGSPASVVAAIREDAELEVERIRETSAAELSAIRAEAESIDVAIADREERLAAARMHVQERIAKQEWDGRRAVMLQREEWMQRVVAAAQLRWPAKSEEVHDALVREARSRLPEGEYEVVDDPRGGCIVRSGDLSFDNSFDARSRRFEPEWRRALSGMYTP
jgi:vacuolar-type H+-ATPase subunit E/Vma4